MRSELYLSKATRDMRAKELKKLGLRVSRFSARNQLLHPQYVNDYPRKLTPEECGFGNTLYRTYFAVLYGIEI